MAEHTIVMTAEQLHEIVGGYFKVDKNPPLELATSTMLNVAEELSVVSTAVTDGDKLIVSNVLHALSMRLETMAKLCDELGKKGGES
jgi:hypothetical protein